MSTLPPVYATLPLPSSGPHNSRWYFGALFTYLLTGADTNGNLLLVEATFQKGSEPPPHLHREESEAYFLIEGEIDFTIGGEKTNAVSGSFVILPKGVPHSFRLVTPTAKALLACWPCALEAYIEEFSQPAHTRGLPPLPDWSTFDFKRFHERSAAYGIQLLK